MDLNQLNPMQRQAAETLEGPLLIIAGAGSGKTRTMTYRIAHLIEQGVKPYHILALTFTNKAAREMLERVNALAGEQAADAWIGTFHSVCVRILRRDIEKLGYQRSFVIYDDDDQLRVIKDILKQMDIDDKQFPPKELRGIISGAKNELNTADDWFRKSNKDYRAQRIQNARAVCQSPACDRVLQTALPVCACGRVSGYQLRSVFVGAAADRGKPQPVRGG